MLEDGSGSPAGVIASKAGDDAIATFIERKVYWETKVKSPLLAKNARNGAPGKGLHLLVFALVLAADYSP
jgi:hypothetical protein